MTILYNISCGTGVIVALLADLVLVFGVPSLQSSSTIASIDGVFTE